MSHALKGLATEGSMPREAMQSGATMSDEATGRSCSVMHVLAPGAVGGLETVVRLLANAQRRAGYDVCVVTIVDDHAPHPYVELLRKDRIDVRVVVVSSRAFLTERRLISAIIEAERPDIVHTHGYRPGLLAGPIAHKMGVRTVATAHGFTGGSFKMRAYERLLERAFRRFDAVIAVSRPLRARLVAHGVASDTVHVIPNAWEPPFDAFVDRQTARAELNIPSGAFALGWVGRLSHEKGLDVLVRAIAALGTDTGAIACVLGSGPSEAEARSLAATLGVSERVKWYGPVADAARLFRAFDVLVLSSRTEGTPMVLLEAMAAGVPIVATSVGGVPDVLSEREALLVPAEQPAALARAIEEVRSEPRGARERAIAARERLDEQFAVQPWLARHQSLYSSMLERPSSTRA